MINCSYCSSNNPSAQIGSPGEWRGYFLGQNLRKGAQSIGISQWVCLGIT